MPYVYAIAQLDEGVRVPTNIVESAPEDVQVDMVVVAVFDGVSVEWMVKFSRPNDHGVWHQPRRRRRVRR